MKKKNILSLLLLAGFISGCNGNEPTPTPTDQPTSENSEIPTSEESNTNSEIPTSEESVEFNKPTTIFLAGDSTVKTYADKQYIGGWGQFLDLFVDENVTIKNCANGGRSSRSFINEGRLFNIDDSAFSYSFSENSGNSIEDDIKEGDFLFIQFGHNDDASKSSNYQTIYDRMVPLGTPDENGIYPTTPASKVSTTLLPESYTSKASEAELTTAYSTIKKYGNEYYSYDSGGTYKWYLKQYIDFARSKNATPVLITPVARVKFSGNEIIGGPGLHGENFAYVEAVRQLANEENCLLIDLFANSKEILETATPTYANYLMALKPNDLNGVWPNDYDLTYGDAKLGYTGIEATHYNKYGAFLQAGKIAETILNDEHTDNEYYSFKDFVLSTPESYVDPSNLISKSVVSEIESLFKDVNITNPNRIYPDFNEVITLINNLPSLDDINNDNYLSYQEKVDEVINKYNGLNIDDRDDVTNYNVISQYQEKIKEIEDSNKVEPVEVITYDFDSLDEGTYTENIVTDNYTIYASSSKNIEIKASKSSATYNDVVYESSQLVKLGGAASFGSGRYISFDVKGACKITVMAKSSSKTDERIINVTDSSKNVVGSIPAPISATFSSVEVSEAGTYSLGSTSGGVYICYIIIEYFN